MIDKIFGEARRILVLSERLENVNRDTQRALTVALENRERIVRLETTVDLGLRMAEQQRRLPPQ